MPRNAMNDKHWAAFLLVLDSVPAGQQVTCNTLRSLLAAADIPEKSRGGLFSQAVNTGFLKPVARGYEPSEGATAHRAVVRIYRRTRKQRQAVAA